MESLMTEETSGEDLVTTLVGIVSCPARLNSLYDVLGTFCHQGRNLLNSVKLSMYLCRRHDASGPVETWSLVESHYRETEVFFDRLQTICRPMNLTPISASLALLFDERRESWLKAMTAQEGALTFAPPAEPAVGQFDPSRLGEGLDVFVRWRAESLRAGGSARLAWRTEDGWFRVDWDEVGLRVENSGVDSKPPSLALPLLARIITAHRGTIDIDHDAGLHLRIRWPLCLCTI